MEEGTDKTENKQNDKPWLYKKGQSGNPKGRPKGKKTMKTWLAERLQKMTDEEREVFLEGINKIDIFKMAEGNPQTDVTSKGEKLIPTPILGGIANEIHSDDSVTKNPETQETP